MKKLVVVVGVIVFMLSWAGKQTNAQIINGAFKRTDVVQKKPMPLPAVREADVFWSKKIWRIIDLREKMNLPLYYPTSEIDGRNNLFNLLWANIENGSLTAYDAAFVDDFANPIPLDNTEIRKVLGAETTMEEKIDFDTGERDSVLVQGDVRPNEIRQFMVYEEWYFDKQNSTLNVRILGLCPIREYIREGDASGQVQRQKVFWVYYPEARPFLSTNMVLNPYNDARNLSFDDLFIKRYFNSYIIKESNVYNNRDISAYLSGREAMLESKRIENEIFNLEQDLWEY